MSLHGVTHDEIERKLSQRLLRWLKTAWDYDAGQLQATYRRAELREQVDTEVEHRGQMPSGKSKCRTDVELELPSQTLAFEVKMSTSDARNWFTQRQDYRSFALTPAIVLTKETAYKLTPHAESVVEDSYIILDEREYDWYWNHETDLPHIETQFEIEEPLTLYDNCPVCGCWTSSTGYTISCANCNWREFVSRRD